MSPSGPVISQVKGVTVVGLPNVSIDDTPVVDSLGSELYALVDQQARRKIILDFTAVRYFPTPMVTVLLKLQKKARAIDGRIILCGLHAKIRELFKVMQLDRILEFAADEREALEKLGILGVS